MYLLLCSWKPKHRPPRSSETALPRASHLLAIPPFQEGSPPPHPTYISNGIALHCKSCLAQVRSSTGRLVRGGQASFHRR